MASALLRALRGVASEPSLRKLRDRLLAINMICLALVICVGFSNVYLNFYIKTQDEIKASLFSIPRSVMENVALSEQTEAIGVAGDTGEGSAENDDFTIRRGPRAPIDYSKIFVANIAADGGTTVYSVLDLKNADYADAIEFVLKTGTETGNLTIANREWRYSFEQNANMASLTAPYNYSVVFLDVEDANRRLDALALSMVIIGIIAIGVIFIISLLVANRAIRPVEEGMMRQRRFVADASHELKTPIAVIAANAEAAKGALIQEPAQAGEDGEHVTAHWVENIADEAARMSGLVNNLLALAKAEEQKPELTSFDLVSAVCEEADRVEAFLFEKNVVFDFELRGAQDGTLKVRSDRAKVQAALSVLLENAVKYTPEGGRVAVTVASVSRRAFVSVANTGAYLPPADLAHIFDRFYRADRSRGSETGGHGIGLSLAKEIVKALGGELTAASAPRAQGGAVNTFTLFLS